MLRDADFGLFAWDGKSKGTLRNIRKMAEQGKPSAVYISPIKKFATIRSLHEALSLSRDLEANVVTSADLFSDAWQTGTEKVPLAADRTDRSAMLQK